MNTERKPGLTRNRKGVLILLGIGMIGPFLIRGHHHTAAPNAAPVQEAASSDWRCNIRKASGILDERKCDLVELCKDAKFYNEKVNSENASGEMANAAQSVASLQQTLQWMAAYRHEDVEHVCNPATLYQDRPPAPMADQGRPPDPSVGLPKTSDATLSQAAAVCDVEPGSLFKTGQLLDDTAIRSALKHCVGAVPTATGNFDLSWNGKNFLVEMKLNAESHEVVGVWLH
jgi:hypothetical protein